MEIRKARQDDAPHCVKLVEERREEYQHYQPTFWKKAANSAAVTLPWFETLFRDEGTVAFVAEEGQTILGFIIAREFPSPPVYDPGGATAMIDDFCVIDKSRWNDVGLALLQETRSEMRKRGFAQIVVVGARQDAAKTELLDTAGLSLASTWWTAPL